MEAQCPSSEGLQVGRRHDVARLASGGNRQSNHASMLSEPVGGVSLSLIFCACRFVYMDKAIEEQCILLCMHYSVAAEARSGEMRRVASRSSQLCALVEAHALARGAASSPALDLHTQRRLRAFTADAGFIGATTPPAPSNSFFSAPDLSRVIVRSECMPFDQSKVVRGLSSVKKGYLYINIGHGLGFRENLYVISTLRNLLISDWISEFERATRT